MWTGSKYRPVDRWDFVHDFPSSGDFILPAGDDTSPNMWLRRIDHVGYPPEGEPKAEPSVAFDIINTLADSNHLGSDVVLHIGTNGTIQPSALDAVLARMGTRRVVLLSVYVPRPWQDLNNRILTEAAHNHPNVHLVDWNAAASAHPEWVWPDGIHLRPEGAAAYRDLIEGALK